jgi:hypothetical protein
MHPEKRKPSEQWCLKQTAKSIRKEIRKLERLMKQRQAVKDLRGRLDDLQYEVQEGHPRSFP